MTNGLDILLAEAVALHQAGDLPGAEALYGKVLQRDSRSVAALYGVGVIAHQVGKNDVAVEYLDEVIRLAPGVPAYFNMRGLVRSARSDIDGAMQDFRTAVELNPDYADGYNSMGVTFRKLGRLDEAIASYRQAIRLNPRMPMACNNLANALKEKGAIDEAAVQYRRALELQPDFAEAHNNLGTLLTMTGDFEEAQQHLRRALDSRPQYCDALNNLGIVYRKLGRLDEAREQFRQVLQLNPGFTAARANLAAVFNAGHDYYAAIEECRRALETGPDSAEAWFNLGLAFKELGTPTKALKYFEKAVELRPDYAGAYNGIANIYRDQGRYESAERYYRLALNHDPANHEVHSNLLFVQSHHVLVAPGELVQAHRQWADIHCREGRAHRLSHENPDRDPERRLRIGYVSGDFRRHAVSFFLEPLLAAHDRNNVEIFCYAEVTRPDEFTDRFRQLADHWCQTVGMSDARLARRIVDDRIDILVDLAGHTGGNRLRVFAWRPAPVQVTYLGYCATTGLDEIDYWVTDGIIHPAVTPEQAVEEIVRLPRCWVCYRPPVDAPPVDLPARGQVTFGCFNDRSKITDHVVEVWADILQRVPGSTLLLKARQYADDGIKTPLAEAFRSRGIDPARILFQPLSLPGEYMASYHAIDIALDPFPRHGGVTTADALWMGVPVITLLGERFIERHCASLLTAIGRDEWIAATTDQYIDTAVALAVDTERRTAIRAAQRERMKNSPLCDAAGLAAAMERAYRGMWRRHVGSRDTARRA